MNEHKHASVLRAIADGVPLSEFEIADVDGDEWSSFISNNWAAWIYFPDSWEIRRKPQYIMVNGFKVPKPLESLGSLDHVHAPDLMNAPCASRWYEPENVRTAIARGIAHATKEAAIAHAKAMLGIDPKWEE